MTGKSERKGSEKKALTSSIAEPVKRKRGRPKGVKNKPKADKPVVVKEKRPRGRPKGAKNKPKQGDAPEVKIKVKYRQAEEPKDVVVVVKKPLGRPRKNNPLEVAPAKIKSEQEDKSQNEHPLFAAITWLEKNMHHNELQYYRSRASKLGSTIHNAIASDILGFFNVQDPEICKQIKKNTFIANVTKHELH
jgi:hypothetical protein